MHTEIMACYRLNRITLESSCTSSSDMATYAECEASAQSLGPDWVAQCFSPNPSDSCTVGNPNYDQFCNGVQADGLAIFDPPDALLDRRAVPCCSQDLCGNSIRGFFRSCDGTGDKNLVPNVCWVIDRHCVRDGGSINRSWKPYTNAAANVDGNESVFLRWSQGLSEDRGCGDEMICDEEVVQRDANGYCTFAKRIADLGCVSSEGFDGVFAGFGCWHFCGGHVGSCCRVRTSTSFDTEIDEDRIISCGLSTREVCELPYELFPDPSDDIRAGCGPFPQSSRPCSWSVVDQETYITAGYFGWICEVVKDQYACFADDDGSRIKSACVVVSSDCERSRDYYFSEKTCGERTECGGIEIPPTSSCCVCQYLLTDVGFFDCQELGGTPVGSAGTTVDCETILNECKNDDFGFAFRENHEDAEGNSTDLLGDLPTLEGRMMPVSEDTLRVSATDGTDGLGNCRHWYGWMEPSREAGVDTRWSGYICNDFDRDSTTRRNEKQETALYARDDGRFAMLAGYREACVMEN